MIRTRRPHRTRVLTGGLAALLAFASAPLVEAAAQQPLTDRSVSMTVLSVSPSTPAATDEPRDFKVVLRLVNTTDQSLSDVTVGAVRGAPISTQQALTEDLAHPTPPDESLSQRIPTKDGKPVTVALNARGAATVTFTTTTGIVDGAVGMCVCARNAIYPIYFDAHAQDVTGSDVTVGSTQTYAPAFFKPDEIQPVQVSWLWPIVERPHRLLDDQAAGQPPVFLDDELARDVATGRLSRLVDVLSTVAGQVPMTVVIDPELVDEVALMAAGPYRVDDGKKTVAGVGTDAAKQWLAQLRDALGEPDVEVSFTPFADPDVQSLVDVGLNWRQTLDTAAQARVDEALGNPPHVGNVWWPVGEALDQSALAAIVQHGASSVVLNERTLPSNQQPPGNGLATVQTTAGPISAVVTSATIENVVGSAIATTGRGLASLPTLVAEVAIRAVEDPTAGSYVAITPPRDIDPDPTNAAAAIRATAGEAWSKGQTVSAAVATVQPSDRGPLVPPQPIQPAALGAINAARELTADVPALSSMFSASDANQLLGSLPAGVQRAESASWRADPAGASLFAARLNEQVRKLDTGVRIVSPPHGRYTLASSNSPLPLTIENNLPVSVTVQLEVTQSLGTGFTARPLEHLVLPAETQRTVKVAAHVDRTGRFSVVATLFTPAGHRPVGCDPSAAATDNCGVSLSVHSTGLGLIGVVITVVAGAILLLALVIRFFRRWRNRGRTTPPAGPSEHLAPERVPA